jgi:uncharacterized protein (DUF427 family)
MPLPLARRSKATSKPVKIPGPDHPITVTPARGRVTVIAAGRTIADTRAALLLKEAAYPPVSYIPRKDVALSLLERTDQTPPTAPTRATVPTTASHSAGSDR